MIDFFDLFAKTPISFIAPCRIDPIAEARCRNLVDQHLGLDRGDAKALLAEIYRLREEVRGLRQDAISRGAPARRLQGLLTGPEPHSLARHANPGTSRRAAAEVVQEGVVDRQHILVLAAVLDNPRGTAQEIGRVSGLGRDVMTRRLPELERLGRVRRLQSRPCRVTGRVAATWVVCS